MDSIRADDVGKNGDIHSASGGGEDRMPCPWAFRWRVGRTTWCQKSNARGKTPADQDVSASYREKMRTRGSHNGRRRGCDKEGSGVVGVIREAQEAMGGDG
ncbi:hypothetical protein NDU88_008670 [Pleurodeles waltl]|uniref:Uncharacterized protein n=1 Tax=Pleurodeles waltl TaxID=8319 RepID=A0AAV7NZY6_PLEWA|nr:hypothetical protein NDU88_008670 [Pleurodeles waltl]